MAHHRGAVWLAALLPLSACAVAPVAVPSVPAPRVAMAAAPAAAPPQFQYLYGSGEAAAISLQAWRGLVAYVGGQAQARPTTSVILTPDATLAAPRFVPCGDKPPAVVVDADETVLLNSGFEARAAAGEPFSPDRWSRWEQTGGQAVAAVPGAADALTRLRAMGITVLFNSNRSAANAAATAATLKAAGLGEAVHGTTLFLTGDEGDRGSAKDGRRAVIAARYCVLAMAGDQLGDFSDRFNASLSVAARRTLASSAPIAALWGRGWFMLPNPVYGTAVKGSLDEIFPSDKRWVDRKGGQ